MREQFKWGKTKYASFIILNLICLFIANMIAIFIYRGVNGVNYEMADYAVIIIYMIMVDLIVTIVFNTLNRVLRRRKKKEVIECIKHVGLSEVILSLVLFSIKQGAEFSRATVFIAYAIYLFFIILFHIVWKEIIKGRHKKETSPTVLLVTTSAYVHDGLDVVERKMMSVKGLFITDKTNACQIRNIPVMVNSSDVTAYICWEWIDKVYICGPVDIDVPEALINACNQMGIPVHTAPSNGSFDYEVIKIRTALQKDDKNTGLSFFEGEHDIPFRISRLYTIYETEQNNQKGFHAHKQSWHLLFCPFGSIDVLVDNGKERKVVSLSDPSVGLILHPSVWREMVWKISGSVLCVAASGHYDADHLRADYSEYLKFLQEKEWSATLESTEIMGEDVV